MDRPFEGGSCSRNEDFQSVERFKNNRRHVESLSVVRKKAR